MTTGHHPLNGGRAWGIWCAAVAVYVLAVFHRSSLAVAGIAAAERFDISASQLSSFTMLQLLIYAAMQLPVGILLDRYGPRRLLTVGMVLMTVGQLGMAVVPTYGLALTTRGLVGVGDAMTFVSVLRLAASWFSGARNPLLTQLTGIVGQLGAVAAALPMAHALGRFGWTTAYGGAALLGIVLGVLMYVVVLDEPGTARPRPALRPLRIVRQVGVCWRTPGTRLGFAIHFTFLGCPTMLALLWGYPWLVDGHGLAPQTAASMLTVLIVASMVSGPAMGVLVTLRPAARLPLLWVMLAASASVWVLALLWPGQAPAALLLVVMLVLGLGGPTAMLGFDFARMANPPERAGIALALVNVGGFASTITAVVAIGLLLDLTTPVSPGRYSAPAFGRAMLVPCVLWAVGALLIRHHAARAPDLVAGSAARRRGKPR